MSKIVDLSSFLTDPDKMRKLKEAYPEELRRVEMMAELLNAGFSIEHIFFSFKPRFYEQADGWYFSKRYPFVASDGSDDDFEFGVLLNPKYDSMEVYATECTVGCCGVDLGVHPFSIEKITELKEGYIRDYL